MIEIRDHRPTDWDAIAAAHDAARLQELAWSVGVEAFRSLAQTAEDESFRATGHVLEWRRAR